MANNWLIYYFIGFTVGGLAEEYKYRKFNFYDLLVNIIARIIIFVPTIFILNYIFKIIDKII